MAGRKVILTPFFFRPFRLAPTICPWLSEDAPSLEQAQSPVLGVFDAPAGAPAVLPNRVKSTVRTPVSPASTDTNLVTDLIQRAYRHKNFKNTPFIVKKKVSIVKRTSGQHCQTQHLQLINRISSLRFVSQIRTEASCQLSASI